MKYHFDATETLGKRIRKIRILKGWTQKELAEKVNLSQSGIYQLESDRCHQTRKIVALSKVLGVPPEELDPFEQMPKINKDSFKRFEDMKRQYPDWQKLVLESVCLGRM